MMIGMRDFLVVSTRASDLTARNPPWSLAAIGIGVGTIRGTGPMSNRTIVWL